MKACSLNEIKKELGELSPSQMQSLCMRLARYKKENKELLTYLLFHAHDEQTYIEGVKCEMDKHFESINKTNLYYVKKSLRKILRIVNKYIKYSGSSQTETELLIYYCQKILNGEIPANQSISLDNLYLNQLKRIHKSMAKLHEDLQHDYIRDMSILEKWK